MAYCAPLLVVAKTTAHSQFGRSHWGRDMFAELRQGFPAFQRKLRSSSNGRSAQDSLVLRRKVDVWASLFSIRTMCQSKSVSP